MSHHPENYDPSFPDQPVVDMYLPIWANQPSFQSKPAFIWADDGGSCRSSITFYELHLVANAMASQLRLQFQRGDTVVLLCSPGLHLVKLLFACQRAGLLSVPVIPPNHSYRDLTPQHHHLLRVLSQSKPVAAIADHGYILALRHSISASPSVPGGSSLLRDLCWISIDDLMSGGGPEDVVSEQGIVVAAEYTGCKADDVYLVQYTSGATGAPKPVLVTAGAAAHNVRVARSAYKLNPNSMIVSWLPQYHDCGLMFLLLTIVAGATCVLTSPTAFVRRPSFWLELVSEFQGSCTPVPSFALPLVVRKVRGAESLARPPLDLRSLKNLVLINEPIHSAPVNEFLGEFAKAGLDPSCISPSYGLAENCTFVSTAWRCGVPLTSIPTYNKLLPSARLASHIPSLVFINQEEEVTTSEEDIEIMVVNEETCEPVEDGVEGEIWVSSASNASGYLGHPSMTEEIFHGRIRGVLSRCFVRTGDCGVVLSGPERYLFVTGRASDIINLRTWRLHPHYIETAAYISCPEHIRGGCVAAFEVPSSYDEKVAIALVAELHSSVENGEGNNGLYKSMCERIREAVVEEEEATGKVNLMVGLVQSGWLPKTTSGKLRRWAAKEKLLAGRSQFLFKVQFLAASVVPARDDGQQKALHTFFSNSCRRLSLPSFL
ncbi:hypothetical protein QJS10_CPB12g00008 [Acorus calamus]|uniref:AMP-dependent synthetase/ligase domain-containing protein n=1 Tax=Acorus calamus TaxID=4465 RepID=A0AAV9DNE1_ACOCL|nr:hypothetical protein QJS10_CPB12g00008 [Acorus calamus]